MTPPPVVQTDEWTIEVPGGLHAPSVLASLAAHALPGAERYDRSRGAHTRLVALTAQVVAVTIQPSSHQVRIAASPAGIDSATLAEVTGVVRFWLDLDTDIVAVQEHLCQDDLLAPLILARPGLRVVRYTEPFEAAVMTVIGQQVSLAAARTFGGRLVESFGGNGLDGLVRFPEPAELARLDPGAIQRAVGLTSARSATVSALARAFADGLRLDPEDEPERARRALLAIPGIGPWTADYLAVRALADPDAFTPSDLVLRRALGNPSPGQASIRADAWRPWRAYALMHLWTAQAYPG